MTDPDRYDLDLLEPLGAVAPPNPEVMDRIADNLRSRFVEHAKSSAEATTLIRFRTRRALPVAATAAVVTAALAVGVAVANRGGHRDGPAPTISAAAAQALRADILTAFANTASNIAYTHSVKTTPGKETMVIDIWTSPFEGSTGQPQTRREVVTLGGQTVQDTQMSYTQPAPDAAVPADCHGPVDSPKPPPIRGSAGILATDGRLIDVEYASRSWSDQRDTCIAVTQPADAAQIRSDIASGDWTVVGRDNVDGRPALELNIGGPGQPVSADLLWVDAQTFLPLRASADKGGKPGADDSFVTTYRFLDDTPANQKNLTTPIPAGFTRTPAPPAPTNR